MTSVRAVFSRGNDSWVVGRVDPGRLLAVSPQNRWRRSEARQNSRYGPVVSNEAGGVVSFGTTARSGHASSGSPRWISERSSVRLGASAEPLDDWLRDFDAGKAREKIKRLKGFSRHVKLECNKYGLACFEASTDAYTSAEAVVQYLKG